MIKTGDRITITSGSAFNDGIVASICNVEDLPTLPGEAAEEVRDALTSGCFARLATIAYEFLGTEMMLCALEDSTGKWWDLNGNILTIKKRPTPLDEAARERSLARVRRDTAYPD